MMSMYLYPHSILDLDPERTHNCQLELNKEVCNSCEPTDTEKGNEPPIIRDDPRFTKYFTMLKMVRLYIFVLYPLSHSRSSLLIK